MQAAAKFSLWLVLFFAMAILLGGEPLFVTKAASPQGDQASIGQRELLPALSMAAQSSLASVRGNATLADWLGAHPDQTWEPGRYGLEYESQGMWCARAVERKMLPAGATLASYALFYPPSPEAGGASPLPLRTDQSLAQRECTLSAVWLEIRNIPNVADVSNAVSQDLRGAWGEPTAPPVNGRILMWGSGRWTSIFTWRVDNKNVWIAADPVGLPTGAGTYDGSRLLILIWDDLAGFGFPRANLGDKLTPANEPSVAEAAARFAASDPALTDVILRPLRSKQPRQEADATSSLNAWLQATNNLAAERRAAGLVLAALYTEAEGESLGLEVESGSDLKRQQFLQYLTQAEEIAPMGRAAELAAVVHAENVCSFQGAGDWRDGLIPYAERFLRNFPKSEWAPSMHYLLARTYGAKLMLAYPGNQEGQPTGPNTPEASRTRQSAIDHYRAFLSANPSDPQAVFAWREAWRLLAGLPPTEIHFLCYFE